MDSEIFSSADDPRDVSAAQIQVADEVSAAIRGVLAEVPMARAALTPPVDEFEQRGGKTEHTYAVFLFDGQTGDPRGLMMASIADKSGCGHDDCPRMAIAHTAADPAENTSNGNAVDRESADEILLSIATATGMGLDPTMTTITADGRFTAQIRQLS